MFVSSGTIYIYYFTLKLPRKESFKEKRALNKELKKVDSGSAAREFYVECLGIWTPLASSSKLQWPAWELSME